MNIVLTGPTGQVGWELKARLEPLGTVIALDRQALDLAQPESIAGVVREARPGLIVNAAAYTAVDRAESEPDLAHKVNALAPGILAEEAKRAGALLVHFSTDYVFDGRKGSPYSENDAPNPLSVYGRTKLEGERAVLDSGCRHLILRTSWVYGPRGRNFLLAILAKAHAGEPLRVVNDQAGAPTSCLLLAQAVPAVIQRVLNDAASTGLYHIAAAGRASWYDFALAILKSSGIEVDVAPIASGEYRAAAQRPRNSLLDTAKLAALGIRLPRWEEGLRTTLEAMSQRLRAPGPP